MLRAQRSPHGHGTVQGLTSFRFAPSSYAAHKLRTSYAQATHKLRTSYARNLRTGCAQITHKRTSDAQAMHSYNTTRQP